LEDRPVLEPNAAGIDVGAREMFVAVPPGRDESPVRVFRHLHRRSGALNRLARAVRGNHSGSGIHWGVLDSTVRDSRTTRHPSLFGECSPHEERTRTAHRLARVPMVTVPAFRGIATGCISARTGHLRRADRAEAPERISFGGQPTRAAHAQGADANEPANPSCHQ